MPKGVYVKTKEHREKISKTQKGRHLSPSTEFKKGQIPWNKGKIYSLIRKKSNDSKEKTSKSLKSFYINHPGFAKEKGKKVSGSRSNFYGQIPKYSYGKRCYYESPIQGKICFKSSYEFEYAKYLDSKSILWYYEIETFNLGNMTYTPDFFLVNEEKFVEVKGYMSELSQNKINKFLEQYPWDLEILYKEDLIKLGIKL